MLKAEEVFRMEDYTEEGQKEVIRATEVFNKMVGNLTPDEIQIIADFDNCHQFGLLDLLQAKLREVKPELFD